MRKRPEKPLKEQYFLRFSFWSKNISRKTTAERKIKTAGLKKSFNISSQKFYKLHLLFIYIIVYNFKRVMN
jgi:hypothetical protein